MSPRGNLNNLIIITLITLYDNPVHFYNLYRDDLESATVSVTSEFESDALKSVTFSWSLADEAISRDVKNRSNLFGVSGLFGLFGLFNAFLRLMLSGISGLSGLSVQDVMSRDCLSHGPSD